MDILGLNLEAAGQGLKRKDFSSVELTKSYLARIKKLDGKIGAYLSVTEQLALAQAESADKQISEGQQKGLTGLPLGIKDVILQEGVKCTGGSKILDNYVATYDATVVKKLKDQGAVMLGKLNLDEFAMGSSTENSAFKKTKNPWALDRVPGGSSGGSAAAVAADMCLATLGSDTGGSIRQPAAFCGVVGLKPTYGTVSRYGLMPMTSSLDQIGPLAKTVRDSAILYNAIAGQDANDSTTFKSNPIEISELDKDIKGMKIGVPKEYFIDGMDSEIRKAIESAVKQYEKLGAKIMDVSLPLSKYALAVYYITASSEISSNIAKYDGIRYGQSAQDGSKDLMAVYMKSRAAGLGSEVKRRIMMGTYALSAGYYDQYYNQAQKVRTLIHKEFDDVFKKVDILLSPTTPSTAFKIGEKFEDPLLMYLSDIYTVPANIGGICAISVPCGFAKGLPIGMQLMGRPFAEKTILNAANIYEQATDWHEMTAKLD